MCVYISSIKRGERGGGRGGGGGVRGVGKRAKEL